MPLVRARRGRQVVILSRHVSQGLLMGSLALVHTSDHVDISAFWAAGQLSAIFTLSLCLQATTDVDSCRLKIEWSRQAVRSVMKLSQ